jgi:pilus assembly protein CpaD
MAKHPISRLCLILGVMLTAACSTPDTVERVEPPKQLRVDHVRSRHIAAFVPGKAELAGGEAQKLAEFLDTAGLDPGDRVYLEPAKDDRLAPARIGRLVREVSRRDIGAETLPPGDLTANQMAVVVERYAVTPPNCPDWTSPAVGDHTNQPPSNFGCATTTNLGLMVADPHDLLIGRTLGPEEGDPAIAAINRYRAGKPKDFSSGGGGGGQSVSPVNISVGASGGGGGGQ